MEHPAAPVLRSACALGSGFLLFTFSPTQLCFAELGVLQTDHPPVVCVELVAGLWPLCVSVSAVQETEKCAQSGKLLPPEQACASRWKSASLSLGPAETLELLQACLGSDDIPCGRCSPMWGTGLLVP